MSPPQFEQPKRKEGSRTGLIITIIVAALGIPCIGCIVLALWFRTFASKNLNFVNDVIAIEVIRESLFLYTEDHQGRLPKADRWQESIAPYYQKAQKQVDVGPFKVPDINKPIEFLSEGGKSKTGLAFNQELSEAKLKEIQNPETTVLLFEVEMPEFNATRPYKPLPDEKSPKIFGESRGWYKLTISGASALDQSRLNRRGRGLPLDPQPSPQAGN